MKNNNFLSIIKKVDPAYEDMEIATTGWIDTGCYALNALISSDIYKGIPDNRSTMLAGDPSTGKTFVALSNVKSFLDLNEDGVVVYFDTEFALDKEMISRRGIDVSRFYIQQPETLQEFRTKALQILENYKNEKETERQPLMFVLDSLGNLPTLKEVTDSLEGSDTRDMTKSQIIRSIFRTITMKLGKLNVPLIVCNHTYDSMSQYSPKEISGGGGAKFAASTILTLSKSQDKVDDTVVGSLIKVTTFKSRYSKERQTVQLKLNFERGLDKYYGLLDIAEKTGVFKKVSTRYELPDGTKVFGKAINENPEKYYTKDILDQINEGCKKIFGLGLGSENVILEDEGQEAGNE